MSIKYTCTHCQKIADNSYDIAKKLYVCACGFKTLDKGKVYELPVPNKHYYQFPTQHVCRECANKSLIEILKNKQEGDDTHE